MAFVEDDLGGHVFRSSTERPGLLATSDLFGKTKVDLETSSPLATPPQNLSGSWHGSSGFILRTPATHQLDVAFSVQHQILGLQVSVEDALTMEVIERLGDAAHAEFGCGFFKTSPEIKEDFSVGPGEATGALSYLSLSRLHTSPPRQASSSM